MDQSCSHAIYSLTNAHSSSIYVENLCILRLYKTQMNLKTANKGISNLVPNPYQLYSTPYSTRIIIRIPKALASRTQQAKQVTFTLPITACSPFHEHQARASSSNDASCLASTTNVSLSPTTSSS